MERSVARRLAQARRAPTSRYLGALSEGTIKHLIEFGAKGDGADGTATAAAHRQHAGFETPEYLLSGTAYRQVLLQGLCPEGRADRPRDYTQVSRPGLLSEVERNLGSVYRCRLAVLEPGQEVGWHVDSADERRFIALLDGMQEFTLRLRKTLFSLSMARGELWFVNTAWPHRVRNPGRDPRIALLGMMEGELA